MRWAWLASVVLLTGFATCEVVAEGENGQTVFNNTCRTCHSVKADDNRLGPHLHGVIGRKAGTVEGFSYSPAMTQSGVIWDAATLDKFIAAPDAVVNGNNMKPFAGLNDAGKRKAIIDYLTSAANDG